ncbi:MAG: hypothetical protein AAFY20_12610 [Cyanobacteria bacterium J06639_14]
MRFIHCEIFQGAIAAVHVEFPRRRFYDRVEGESEASVITPVVMKHFGEAIFLAPVDSVDEAIAAAKEHIEGENRSYINQVIGDQVPASEAIQHFQDCDIPLEMVPPLVAERPHYPPYPSPLAQVLISQAISPTVVVGG